jgi:hypothetical protein
VITGYEYTSPTGQVSTFLTLMEAKAEMRKTVGGTAVTGPADRLVVSDADGHQLTVASLARPPTTEPPDVPPAPGRPVNVPNGWWCYPLQVQPPSLN